MSPPFLRRLPRVEHLAERVADEREGDHRQTEEDDGNDRRPPARRGPVVDAAAEDGQRGDGPGDGHPDYPEREPHAPSHSAAFGTPRSKAVRFRPRSRPASPRWLRPSLSVRPPSTPAVHIHTVAGRSAAMIDDPAEVDRPGTATLDESRTEMTELLLPNDTNNLGRALGGAVLHWMDICGAIAGMRFSNRQCVTASMDHVDFIAPIDLGEVAVVEAYAFNVGRTSIDVKVDVRAENPKTDERRQTTTSFFTFVALDEAGQPTAVPALKCPTPEEEALRREAVEEREEQLEAVYRRMDGE